MAKILELPQKQNEEHEKVWLMPIEKLHPFKNQPFTVKDDELMDETIESIENIGLTTPLIVRKREEGG